jgi:predicted cupin superfamily sugar epimerase
MPATVQELIAKLELQPHPEGGYFKETYRSEGNIDGDPEAPFPAGRSYSTGIYFLLEGDDFSAFHRIRSDELWHFYEGGPLHIFVIDDKGELSITTLGRDIAAGEVYQAAVKAGHWFASAPVHPDQYALVGCTVSPGFDFRDFEMAARQDLTTRYPQYAAVIDKLTRI